MFVNVYLGIWHESDNIPRYYIFNFIKVRFLKIGIQLLAHKVYVLTIVCDGLCHKPTYFVD